MPHHVCAVVALRVLSVIDSFRLQYSVCEQYKQQVHHFLYIAAHSPKSVQIFQNIHHEPMTSFISMSAFFLSCLLALSLQAQSSNAFSTAKTFVSNERSFSGISKTQDSTSTQLGLFGGLFGKKEEDNRDPSVPKRVFEIPCKNLKLGGCRFVLGLFLIGQQGTPVKGAWKANQANDGVLDMYYLDNTAMFSVVMAETSISVDRYGLDSSLQYQLQESLVLHNLLDEIQTLALEGEEIEDGDRLIVFSDPETAIADARAKLPARAA